MQKQNPARAKFRQPYFKIMADRFLRMMAINMQQIDALRPETLRSGVKGRSDQSRKRGVVCPVVRLDGQKGRLIVTPSVWITLPVVNRVTFRVGSIFQG